MREVREEVGLFGKARHWLPCARTNQVILAASQSKSTAHFSLSAEAVLNRRLTYFQYGCLDTVQYQVRGYLCYQIDSSNRFVIG